MFFQILDTPIFLNLMFDQQNKKKKMPLFCWDFLDKNEPFILC